MVGGEGVGVRGEVPAHTVTGINKPYCEFHQWEGRWSPRKCQRGCRPRSDPLFRGPECPSGDLGVASSPLPSGWGQQVGLTWGCHVGRAGSNC